MPAHACTHGMATKVGGGGLAGRVLKLDCSTGRTYWRKPGAQRHSEEGKRGEVRPGELTSALGRVSATSPVGMSGSGGRTSSVGLYYWKPIHLPFPRPAAPVAGSRASCRAPPRTRVAHRPPLRPSRAFPTSGSSRPLSFSLPSQVAASSPWCPRPDLRPRVGGPEAEPRVDERESASYPGDLPSRYVLHAVDAEVVEGEGHGGGGTAIAVKRHYWTWIDEEDHRDAAMAAAEAACTQSCSDCGCGAPRSALQVASRKQPWRGGSVGPQRQRPVEARGRLLWAASGPPGISIPCAAGASTAQPCRRPLPAPLFVAIVCTAFRSCCRAGRPLAITVRFCRVANEMITAKSRAHRAGHLSLKTILR
ncbi:hypothetical protein BRADI_4g13687v3 [Brachypodium distachyon]|uniref:Uncharacterized protein n=1 Tax=Brachypodium distachyon TaxID=15368 RepID=A0A2K2CMM8_BRADI|nr:hypothetical protein BRADI_4g13687v3 [Brachypodium distachyon]